jgi:molybdate transport system substrate-binding protein
VRTRVAAAAALALVLAGCGGGGGGAAAPSGGAAPSAAPSAAAQGGGQTLTVLAAASLTETFTNLEKQFEADHPGVDVKLNFAGSSDLAQQIVNGAPADVFAAASDATMKTVTDAGLANGTPKIFATNVLQIATAPGNPKGIASFADLAKPDLKVVVCAPQVPCGAAAAKLEQATGVDIKPVSEESDVKSTLGKVTSGDADAGLVYVTDVDAAGGSVEGVSFTEAAQATTNYPIAVLKNAPQAQLAQQFEDVVTGDAGHRVLEDAGFGPGK